MENKAFIAEFNAEEKYKTGEEYSLPSFSFPGKIVDSLHDGMDGLLLCMLEEGDSLITKYKLPSKYLTYWKNNFFGFNNIGLLDETDIDDKNVYQLIGESQEMCKLLEGKTLIEYSNNPDYCLLASKNAAFEKPMDSEIIRTINKKSFSNTLKLKYGLNGAGINVTSIEAFELEAKGLLKTSGKILIKDSLGVSGKGIQIIESEMQIARLVKHFKKQKESGKQIFDFVIEPYFNKKIDFSCHFHIDKNGNATIQGYQKNNNKGFAYKESVSLVDAELLLIESSDYKSAIHTVSKELFDMGYNGFVCLDSMILENDEIIEIVEINPRMSMARFNLNMQKKVGRLCCLTYSDVSFANDYYIDDLLDELYKNDLLYSKGGKGVVPLAPGTWSIHRFEGNKGIKLRAYYLIVYDSEDEMKSMREFTNELLNK